MIDTQNEVMCGVRLSSSNRSGIGPKEDMPAKCVYDRDAAEQDISKMKKRPESRARLPISTCATNDISHIEQSNFRGKLQTAYYHSQQRVLQLGHVPIGFLRTDNFKCVHY